MTRIITEVEPSVHLITPVEYILSYVQLLEQAGRTCYQSGDKISELSGEKFIRGIIRRGHESVIEHCSITYRMIMSRACSHQLVRHRLCAFSQESMRYCDYGQLGFQIIVPPKVKECMPELYQSFLDSCRRSYDDYCKLRDQGVPAEDARFILPNASKTEVVVTSNLRNWRHMIKERGLNSHAQWEIRKLFLDVLYELNHYLPVCFGDLVEQLEAKKNERTKITG